MNNQDIMPPFRSQKPYCNSIEGRGGGGRLQYPAKLSIMIDKEIKTFHDKSKYMQFLFTDPFPQDALEGKH